MTGLSELITASDARAFEDGKKNGAVDRRLGRRSEVGWWSTDSTNAYASNYSRGYRVGWLRAEESSRA